MNKRSPLLPASCRCLALALRPAAAAAVAGTATKSRSKKRSTTSATTTDPANCTEARDAEASSNRALDESGKAADTRPAKRKPKDPTKQRRLGRGQRSRSRRRKGDRGRRHRRRQLRRPDGDDRAGRRRRAVEARRDSPASPSFDTAQAGRRPSRPSSKLEELDEPQQTACIVEGMRRSLDEAEVEELVLNRTSTADRRTRRKLRIAAEPARGPRRAPGYARRVTPPDRVRDRRRRRYEQPQGAPTEPGADRDRAAAGGPQPAPARGGRARRGAAAGPRRRRLGQDPGADPPDRLPAGHRRGPPGRDPRDHLHQQGGRGDARAGRPAGRPLGAGDVGDDLPLRLRADAARRRRAARLLARLHDLRRVGLAADAQTLPARARRRPEALPAAGDPLEDLRRQEPADRRRHVRRNAGQRLRGGRRRGLPALREADARSQRDGLRRPAGPHGQRAGALRGGPRALAPHLPPRPRRRVPGHQPRPVPAAAAALRPSTAT